MFLRTCEILMLQNTRSTFKHGIDLSVFKVETGEHIVFPVLGSSQKGFRFLKGNDGSLLFILDLYGRKKIQNRLFFRSHHQENDLPHKADHPIRKYGPVLIDHMKGIFPGNILCTDDMIAFWQIRKFCRDNTSSGYGRVETTGVKGVKQGIDRKDILYIPPLLLRHPFFGHSYLWNAPYISPG